MNENELLNMARALQLGSEDEAVDALRQIMGGSEERVNFQTAVAELVSYAPYLQNDEILRNAANGMDQQMIAQGDRRPYQIRYAEICERIEQWCAEKGYRATTDHAEIGVSDVISEMRKGRMPRNDSGA